MNTKRVVGCVTLAFVATVASAQDKDCDAAMVRALRTQIASKGVTVQKVLCKETNYDAGLTASDLASGSKKDWAEFETSCRNLGWVPNVEPWKELEVGQFGQKSKCEGRTDNPRFAFFLVKQYVAKTGAVLIYSAEVSKP